MATGKDVLKTKIFGKEFKNPIWTASGTFGCGEEFEDFLSLKEVGAVVTKTVTLKEREGNRPPRVVETPSGMLNSIGLENKGALKFKEEKYPFLKKMGTKVIVSISGPKEEEFVECAKIIAEGNFPDAIEVNLSCPNVKHGKVKHSLIAQDGGATRELLRRVKKAVNRPVIAKLSPNVTSVAKIAKEAERGGADAVALVNTYYGMAVSAEEAKPLLGNITGGLSGPAIKPMALKAVYDVYKTVKVPVIGMGGIMTGEDVAEFLISGATCVQVGTANLADPSSYRRILKEFKDYLRRKKIKNVKELVGKLKT